MITIKTLFASTALVAIACLSWPNHSLGQDIDPKPEDVTLPQAAIDFSIPNAPAFQILGVSPSNVITPGSGRDLAVSLIDGLDVNGQLQSGLAVDFSPYAQWAGSDVTLEKYQSDFWTKFLWRTQVSLATAKGIDDDEAVRAAIGFRFTPFDDSDPRGDEDLLECLTDALDEAHIEAIDDFNKLKDRILALERKRSLAPGEFTEPEEKLLQKLNEQKDLLDSDLTPAFAEKAQPAALKCRNDNSFVSNKWSKNRLSLGFAPTFDSQNGNLGNLGFSNLGLWAAGTLRISDDAMFEGSASFTSDQLILDDETQKYFEQDNLTIGGRVRYGSPELNFFVEAAYVDVKVNGGADDHYYRLGAGADFRVVDDTYLSLGLSGDQSRDGEDDTFVLANLKWAFSPTPTYALEK